MSEIALLYNNLAIGGALFALGLIGFLVRRNLIVMFLCAEMMLQGVSINLIGWGRYHGGLGLPGAWDGQMLVIFIITIAACEAGIAMVLVLMLARRSGKGRRAAADGAGTWTAPDAPAVTAIGRRAAACRHRPCPRQPAAHPSGG